MSRECGDCTLCCRLLPVKGINKPALKRCQHQRHGKGCAVYHKPEKGFPWECGLWSCVWLAGNDAAGLRRPDRCHYVIDIMPDYIVAQEGDAEVTLPAIQIWVDPKYPDAHRDPALRAWLLRRQGWVGIARFSGEDAVILIPPYMMASREWSERSSNLKKETHSFDKILKALSGVAA